MPRLLLVHGSVRVPCLVITGTADHLTPVKYGRYLADNIRKAQFVTFDGAGHLLGLDYPEEVAAEIKRFLVETFPEGN